MNPPAHVCRALYKKYPDLRLAWHGLWGKFCVVWLCPKRMTPVHGSAFLMFGASWDLEDRLNEHGELETVASSKGPIFNKHGVGTPDWDVGMYDAFIVAPVNNIYDVFSGFIVKGLEYVSRAKQRKEEAAHQFQRGRELKETVYAHEEETAKKVKYYTDRHDGVTINTAKKHLDAAKKEESKGKPVNDRGLEYYYVDKRGLGKYLDE